jgi:hypothetical protein
MLTEEQKAYYSLYEDLFEHPGWPVLLREFIQPEIDDLPERGFQNAKNFPELVQARGKYQAYLEFASIPAQIALTKEEAMQQNQFEAEANLELSRPDV